MAKSKAKVKTDSQSAPFRFFDLPPEIRASILRFAATDEVHIALDKSYNLRAASFAKPARPLLMLVSKTFRHEAKPYVPANTAVIVDVYYSALSGVIDLRDSFTRRVVREHSPQEQWLRCILEHEHLVLDLRVLLRLVPAHKSYFVEVAPENLQQTLAEIAAFDARTRLKGRRLTIRISRGHLLYLWKRMQGRGVQRAGPSAGRKVWDVLSILTHEHVMLRDEVFQISSAEGSTDVEQVIGRRKSNGWDEIDSAYTSCFLESESSFLPSIGLRLNQQQFIKLLVHFCTRRETDPSIFIERKYAPSPARSS